MVDLPVIRQHESGWQSITFDSPETGMQYHRRWKRRECQLHPDRLPKGGRYKKRVKNVNHWIYGRLDASTD